MKSVLIVSGHPNLAQSNANKAIIDELKHLLPNAEVSNLGALYPDFKIAVEAEQKKLLNADVIVWQAPVYWYSVPAILKKWIDDVFTYGFAYGGTGDKLKGKKLILSFTAGAGVEDYTPENKGEEPFENLLPPHKETAALCQLSLLDPVISFEMMYLPGLSPESALTALQSKAKDHARQVFDQISNL